MDLRLGDFVIKRMGSSGLLFQVLEFDGEKVILKGVGTPLITVLPVRNLIKINRKRNKANSVLRRVK